MKELLLLVGLCYLFGLGIPIADADVFNDEHRLIAKIFNSSTYIPDLRPVAKNETINVLFGVGAVSIVDLDEKEHVLRIYAWLRLTWQDQRLTWDPAKYGDVKVVRVSAQRVWKPDIELYNSAVDSPLLGESDQMNAIIYSDGTVLWIPPKHLQASCEMDLWRFPFDSQTCFLKFGSWSFDGFQVDLSWYEGRSSIDMTDFIEHREWDVTKNAGVRVIQYYPCCSEPYPYLQFNLTFKRRSTYYSNILIGPAVVMAFLIPLTFLMPSESGEKVILGGAIMICLILMVLMLAPALSTTTAIVTYFSSSFILMGVTLALSAMTSNLSRWKSQPPAALSKIMIGCFARILCVDPATQASEKEDDPAEKGQADDVKIVEPLRVVSEWKVISIVMDRFLAVVFLVVVVILTIAKFA